MGEAVVNMPVSVRVKESGGSGSAESSRTYQIDGNPAYRHAAVPTLARLSAAVEHNMDFYRDKAARDRVAASWGDF
jgi:hypothetical protein